MAKSRKKPTRQDTIEWFRDAKFGLFIHWGVYSLLGKGEWIQTVDQIPVAEYEKLYPRFNPKKFEPDAWADLAKSAGMKYMVFTTKHHDGFCMWDTDQTDYNIMHTPYGKDILREVTTAFRRRGLRVGYYHSILDWHHPDYLPRRPYETEEERPTKGCKRERYVKYMRAQIKELLTGYGDIFVLWYDGGWEGTAEELDSATTNAMARRLQPDILINNRSQLPEDLQTPEQRIPPTGLVDDDGNPVLWEACMTMTSHWWGYDKHETNFKSPEFLIRMLVDIVSKGGNLLLNVGPRPDGTIQKEFVDRLKAIGNWMDRHGEAIYGTTASPFNLLPFHGRVTTKGERLYAHVFDWPADGVLRLPGLGNEIKRAWVLEKGRPKLECERDGDDWLIRLPAKAPDKIASVIGVDLDGPPQVEPFVIAPDEKGVIDLPALHGLLDGTHGQRIRYETQEGIVHAGNWIRTPDTITWEFTVPKGGAYKLMLEYALPAGQGGSECAAVVNGKETPFKTTATGGEFKRKTVGEVRLKKGVNTLQIKADAIKKEKVMDLRGATLQAVK